VGILARCGTGAVPLRRRADLRVSLVAGAVPARTRLARALKTAAPPHRIAVRRLPVVAETISDNGQPSPRRRRVRDVSHEDSRLSPDSQPGPRRSRTRTGEQTGIDGKRLASKALVDSRCLPACSRIISPDSQGVIQGQRRRSRFCGHRSHEAASALTIAITITMMARALALCWQRQAPWLQPAQWPWS
jgi:hypothetical protein